MKAKYIIIAIATLFAGYTVSAESIREYSLDSISSIVTELSKDEYEEPVKEWLKEHRPGQYADLFSEDAEDQASDESATEETDLFSGLLQLGAMVADRGTILLDYYINSKAQEGWLVVSLTDRVILFERNAEP